MDGYDDNAIKKCVAHMEKQQEEDPKKSINSPENDVFSPTHISQTQFEDDMHDEMSLRTQFDPLEWVK